MKTFLVLTLAGICSSAAAQTPANNPMPDGSRDMYVGLGALSAPEYEGGRERRTSAQLLLQAEFSNGIFFAGSSAGMHLSSNPELEYGPLLAYQGRRNAAGTARGPGSLSGMLDPASPTLAPPPGSMAPNDIKTERSGTPLAGVESVKARLLAGGFFNYYLTPRVRLTSSVLGGAGRERDGALLTIGVQQLSSDIGSHHKVSVSGGITLVNASYNRSFFGVTPAEALRGGTSAYVPDGGLKDIHAGARWNWTLAPSWLLSSGVNVARLQGDAKNSPLVPRSTVVSVSTGLAYRY